ncbi:hypothetical protein T492DRAFT_1139914 [Pavlovales sp. CCMP2436]|nr:hypothetical protein T492DRAFT_1139914 [Pavlovales sp. CCMP2436]
MNLTMDDMPDAPQGFCADGSVLRLQTVSQRDARAFPLAHSPPACPPGAVKVVSISTRDGFPKEYPGACLACVSKLVLSKAVDRYGKPGGILPEDTVALIPGAAELPEDVRALAIEALALIVEGGTLPGHLVGLKTTTAPAKPKAVKKAKKIAVKEDEEEEEKKPAAKPAKEARKS